MSNVSIEQVANNTTLILAGRAMQLIGIPIMLWYMWWSVTTLNKLQIDTATNATLIAERSQDRYTATDARHDFYAVSIEVDDLQRRVGVLEGGNHRQQFEPYQPLMLRPPPGPTPNAVVK